MKRALVLLALSLTACASPQQRAQRAVDEFGPACQTYGFKPGTPEHAACIQNAAAEEQARYNAAAAIIYKGTRPTPTVNCRTTPDGMGGSRTTCQ